MYSFKAHPAMDAMTFEKFTFCEKKIYMHKSWVYVTERDGMTEKKKKGAPI